MSFDQQYPKPDLAPTASYHGKALQVGGTQQCVYLPDGKLYQRRPGGNFHLQITVRGQLLRKTTGTNDITQAMKQAERYRQHGIPGSRDVLPTLDDLRQLIAAEAAAGRLNAKTAWTYENKINLLQQFFQEQGWLQLPLSKIAPDLIRQYLVWRRDRPTLRNGRKPSPGKEHRRVSPRTLNNDLEHLRACFRRAMQGGWIDHEPTATVARDRKAARPRPRPLSADQINRLFHAAQTMTQDRHHRHHSIPCFVPLMETILSCGLRREEARMLTKADIDWSNQALLIRKKSITAEQIISIPQAKYKQAKACTRQGTKVSRLRLPEGVTVDQLAAGCWHDKDHLVVIQQSWCWETKGDHAERSVPIPEFIMDRIREWAQRPLTAWYPHNKISHHHQRLIGETSHFLFPEPDGGPLRSNINHLIGEAAQIAQIPHPRLHDLRHTYATWLRQKDTSIPTLQRLLGHQDMATTLM